MEDNNKEQSHCTGNCMDCIPQQRYLCASQISYHNMKLLEVLTPLINELTKEVQSLKRIVGDHYLQDVFDPLAQEGDGAKTIESPK